MRIEKTVRTFWANIYVGLLDTDKSKELGYSECFPYGAIEHICKEYCNETGFCVTVTPTKYIYTGGEEDGAIVGIINYPRFFSTPELLKERALILAEKLRDILNQYRVTVVMPEETVMLSRPGTKD